MTAPAVTREPRDDMLLGLLAEWLRGRRWFPAKGVAADLSCVGGLTLVDPLDEADVRILLVRTAAPGVDTVLQVPLTLRATGGDHAERTIGVLGLDEPSTQDAVVAGARTDVLDGAGDPAFLRAWLAAAQGPGAEVDPARAQVLTGEQSNTSVLLPGSGQAGAGSAIIKVFRALAPGANPDVDVPRALADEGWENVPRPLAWLEATWPSGTSTVTGHLGVVSEFVPGARDGFELACAMAGGGESFAPLAEELGAVIAGMHAALARAIPMSDEDAASVSTQGVADAVTSRFRWACDAVPSLTGYADAVQAVADRAAALTSVPSAQRIHGDLHLGQALRAHGAWFLTDFEGEPLAPIATRSRPDLPVRDVAGVLRSFDYAAAVGGADESWTLEAREALLRGYRDAQREAARVDVMGRAVTEVSATDALEILRAVELERALYEAVYEARNRPTWSRIPGAALTRLLGPPAL